MSKIVEWNDYNIDRKFIGKGTFAKVYRGVNKITNQEVAIKKISFEELPDKIKSRTLIEINILKSLEHENIIKFYDYKFENNNLFIITEYCNQGNLSNWLNKHKSSDEIFDKFKQIVEGINYLHSNKIVHRDIKPQNILLHNSKIKICDFGFSQTLTEEISMLKTICGTPIYMSPEVLNMCHYNIKSEIWSLGILLYQIFFNVHPYGKLSSIPEYKIKLCKQPIFNKIKIFNNQLVNNIFNDLLYKMLSFNPDLRPSSEQVLLEINKCLLDKVSNTFFLEDSKLLNTSKINTKLNLLKNIKQMKIDSDSKLNLVANDNNTFKFTVINNKEKINSEHCIHSLDNSELVPIPISLSTSNNLSSTVSSFVNSPNFSYLNKIGTTESKLFTLSPNNTVVIENYFDKVIEERNKYNDKISKNFSTNKYISEKLDSTKSQFNSWALTIYNYILS